MPSARDEMVALAEAYAAVGVTDILLVLTGDDAVARAEQTAGLLPRLRAVA